MPPAVAIAGAAVVGAGASMYAGSKAAGAQKSAANAAAAASERSTQLQVEESRRQYDQTRGDYAPYREAGYGALDKLQDMYGIAPQTASGGTTFAQSNWDNAPETAGYKAVAEKAPAGVDYAAYVRANPDAAAQWSNQTDDLDAFGGDINKFGAFHYVNDGSRRDISSYSGAKSKAISDGGTTPRNQAGIPGPDYSEIGNEPDYTDVGDAPTYRTPNYAKFEESPGYKFRLQQGIDAVKANASARGLLRSTATMKNIDRFAEGTAAQEYDAFYNRATAAADNEYARNRSAYDTAYNRKTAAYDSRYNRITSGYDAYANRLAAMAGVGQTATGQTATAGSAASTAIANAYGANGTNQANAAMARGNATASAYSNLGSSISNGAQNLASLYLYQNNGGFGGGGNPGFGGGWGVGTSDGIY